jgi:hypothetical protein
MKIIVHVKDKVMSIPVGEGAQRIKWLGDVSVLRYDNMYGMITGTPKGIRYENGTFLDLNAIISESVQDDQHVWIVLQEDMEAIDAEARKKKRMGGSQAAPSKTGMAATALKAPAPAHSQTAAMPAHAERGASASKSLPLSAKQVNTTSMKKV